MDREIWKGEFSETACPPYPCPSCKKGTVSLIKGSVTRHETAESEGGHQHEAFDWDWIAYTFTAWAQCSRGDCKAKYGFVGKGGIAPVEGEDGVEYEDYFAPMAAHPPLDIIEIPNGCPQDVVTELRAAFQVFWVNRAACASRLRVSLEKLMTHLGAPRRQRKNNKYVDITLHARIDLYAQRKPDLGAQIMALKWLGNTGSHDGDVSNDDLLDALEILEHALKELIGGHSKRVAKLAKKLTKKHAKK